MSVGKKCTVCGMVMREERDGRSETTGRWLCDYGHQQISGGDEEFAQFVFAHFGGHWIRRGYERTEMHALPERIARRVDELARAKRLADSSGGWPERYRGCCMCRYPTQGERCADEWCERRGCCGHAKVGP